MFSNDADELLETLIPRANPTIVLFTNLPENEDAEIPLIDMPVPAFPTNTLLVAVRLATNWPVPSILIAVPEFPFVGGENELPIGVTSARACPVPDNLKLESEFSCAVTFARKLPVPLTKIDESVLCFSKTFATRFPVPLTEIPDANVEFAEGKKRLF